jgi:hypothetical protein
MISDSYDLKLTDNVIYEADCARITVGGDNIGMSASISNKSLNSGPGADCLSSRYRCQPLR